MSLRLSEQPDGSLEFWVHVQPRAAQTTLVGIRDGALVVRISSPPVDDAANEALRRFLAGLLDVPYRSVTITAGARSRRKRVRVMGIRASVLRSRLGAFDANG
ncbi:DUF167 domain-containing protein [Thermomicrobium sp. 4228-Ro]|uniref:DUF167 domain-containing protein n=1 Tax=Thermomicrobium sp. 4228-Ro TaxID=2993937 RepID=UPI0022489498|nr:DUF167 domain-containing protein [Thermomicrobium sp. 4228-Ro]MCX2726260.1 DUF167 domain-containing protein [Thermomicrobium sp. 4228-Ro]